MLHGKLVKTSMQSGTLHIASVLILLHEKNKKCSVTRVKKWLSGRVLPRVMHIIQSETLGETLGEQKKSRQESRLDFRIELYARLLAKLSPRFVFLRG